MRNELNHAIVCHGGDTTTLQTVDTPLPDDGEMLLRMRVSGFCGTDLFKLNTGQTSGGLVLGHEIVGEVAETGKGCRFNPGQRIVVPHHVACGECALCRAGSETMCDVFKENLMAPGGFADAILIRERAVRQAAFAVPDGVDDERAVFLEPGACVLRGINRSGIADDGVAVIIGGGSMGLLHLLVLKALSPDVGVVVIDLKAERCELARRLGADAAVPPGEAARAAVQELSRGLGADAVFDTVGGQATLAAGLELTRHGGSVVLFAHAPDGAAAGFDLNTLFKNEKRIIATYSGSLVEQRQVFDLIASGRLDASPLVTHRMPLDEFAKGVELARSQSALKVLFTPSLAGQGSAAQ